MTDRALSPLAEPDRARGGCHSQCPAHPESVSLAAVSIGTLFCFCVGGWMLITLSPAGPFRRPAIAKQGIPPFDRPRIPLHWCQVFQRVVIRSGRRSKCRRLARFNADGRGRRQCPPILTHWATAMSASVLQSHVPVEVFEAADACVQPCSIIAAILTCATAQLRHCITLGVLTPCQ